ncbi:MULTISPECIES: FAD-dependent monooxygenase [unclassified Amycolatopsis]|uniref:FAD-dependent monooxygenase n=1 Tax=unclassified Amycolatopsis TaxID=2618356 RepID=UPI0028748FBD|nr:MULTISPECIES: FAD-dependent monooxygenase [unclassified Amycolatopsis]MDS0139048.1 FAD-dependent monooxygenase [Amycolatopsis sp. 505]MDS0147720.1 FAD-dependent monooxygenase [Amycolatopsis sp. CM201R]
MTKHILISGAGVAGPALAWWLHHHGFQATVVERAPSLREGGYKVDIRGVAVDVVRRMGLLERVHAASTDMRGAAFVNKRGKQIATLDADTFGFRHGDDTEILRGDLARILHDATRSHTEYLFGDWITGLDQGPHGVEVTFAHGEPRRFDLVVGADGLHSGVRALAFGPEEDYLRRFDAYISISTVPNTFELDRWELLHSAAPGKMVNVYSTARAHDAKAAFWFTAPPLPYDRRDVDGQKDLVADRFAGLGWEIPDLLSAMREADDFYFDPVCQVVMDRLSAGRVTLLGDAGYCPSPASGQGTSLALAGAYVLAGELASNYSEALPRYEALMRPFIEKNQALAKTALRGIIPQSRAFAWFNTRMIKLMPYLPGRNRVLEQMSRPIREAANALELPDYAASAADRGPSS